MDLLRAVLGDAQLNYLGYSYGTFLGATYAKLYPERVGRLVLDGAIDPVGLRRSRSAPRRRIGFESALRAYMADCLAGVGLPVPRLGRRGDGRPRRRCSPASTSHPLRGGGRPDARRRLAHDGDHRRALLRRRAGRTSRSRSSDALQGDPDVGVPARRLLLRPRGRRLPRQLDRGVPRLQLHGLSRRRHAEDEAAGRAAIARREAPTDRPVLVGSRPLRRVAVPADRHARTDRRRRGRAHRGRRHHERSGDAVRVGGRRSPISWRRACSSPAWARATPGYNKGNACVDAAVEAYLLDGTVPEDGLRCE